MMVGKIFVAMFLGALAAVTLVVSGWSLWLVMLAYMFFGIFGLAAVVALEYFRRPLSIGMKLIVSFILRLKIWRQKDDDFIRPRPIPALSDWHSATNRR